MHRLLALGLSISLLSACSVDLALGSGAAGRGAAEQARGGLEMAARAEVLVGGGAGRVPAVAGRCPDDADSVRRVVREVSGESALTPEEEAAFAILLRTALACEDLSSDPEYRSWSAR